MQAKNSKKTELSVHSEKSFSSMIQKNRKLHIAYLNNAAFRFYTLFFLFFIITISYL